MTAPRDPEDLALLREDLAYHQARVLLLIDAVAAAQGHQGKVDGLTKLAKLDFLLRYPALAPAVLDRLNAADPRLRLPTDLAADPADVEAPMIRYKYGPWDDRYYAVIGALVGRGLLRYMAGRRGSVALAPTRAGREFADNLAAADEWSDVAERSKAIAESSAGMSGNALKTLIYQRLASFMDRQLGEVIR
ncbi:MAG TPA: hypothetical protein VNF47_23435 [Streptosporangiaceae bacterium]|nr:hypothetical protein [Streptosporangiaceae bacterium]